MIQTRFPLIPILFILSLVALTVSPILGAAADSDSPKDDDNIRVAVVTGGHGFDKEAFLGLFESEEDITYEELVQKDDSEVFEDISDWHYDVIALYHMTQEISPKRQANFIQLLTQGVGVVALHHSIAAFQDWPEYERIIGGKYHLERETGDETGHEPSGYKHDVDFAVQVEDHPISEGLKDFSVHDETYINYSIAPDNTPLLTTDDPTSEKLIGWTRTYKNARTCYIQPGHGASIFSDDTYKSLVNGAIRWCVDK